jgi:arylsulfatase
LIELPTQGCVTTSSTRQHVEVAQVKVKRTMGYRILLDETFDIGMDAGEPVSEEYHVPFDFSGKIGSVVVKLGSGD